MSISPFDSIFMDVSHCHVAITQNKVSETLFSVGIDVEEARYRSQVKNVVELRQKLVKEFISGRCFQRTKCPHCVTHLRGLKQEQNNKMFFSSMAKKTITQLKERTPQNTVTLAKNMVK